MSAGGMKTRSPILREEGYLPKMYLEQMKNNTTEWTVRVKAVPDLSPYELDETQLQASGD